MSSFYYGEKFFMICDFRGYGYEDCYLTGYYAVLFGRYLQISEEQASSLFLYLESGDCSFSETLVRKYWLHGVTF
jgi:hypothetical protein